ncbi:MAG: glycosyltransferase family 4 protein [bacterium]
MQQIFLPTLDFAPRRGGVARYLAAIKETFPQEVSVVFWDKELSRIDMAKSIVSGAEGCDQIWTSHILPVGTMIWLTRRLHRKPYVIILHGMDFDLAGRNMWKRWLSRNILNDARSVVTNSKALAREVAKFAGIDEPIVVSPCVDDDLVSNSCNHDYDNDDDYGVKLLTVGRLVRRKGHLKVLKAIKDLPNIEYTIVGDGPERSEIENKIVELGLSERCNIRANVTDEELAEIYRTHNVFIMPTTKSQNDREGFGIVYLEAQLFGLPIIATRHPGIDEAVIDKVTGLLVKDEIQAIEKAIEKLAENKVLRQRMGQAGREFVLAGFTRDKQFGKLKELIV